MKTILFIEDFYDDFKYFTKVFEMNGYHVFPKKEHVKNQINLTEFLGKDLINNDYQNYNEQVLICVAEKMFSFINDNSLYEKLSLIILDVNLAGNNDTVGLEFLAKFRLEFIPKNLKYKEWNKTIPVIALTSYNAEKYKEEFKNYPGYLLGFHHKESIKNFSETIINEMNNFHEQMSAIYPLFYDPELKDLLSLANKQQKEINEIKKIAKLVLFSQIAQMEIGKREAFIENFTSELIHFTKGINGFMIDIENGEVLLKQNINKFFETPPVKVAGLISSVITMMDGTINPDSSTNFIDKFISLLG